MAGISLKQAWDNPSFLNIAGAVLDVAAVAIPIVPAVGGRAIDAAQLVNKAVDVAGAANKADNVADAGKAAGVGTDAARGTTPQQRGLQSEQRVLNDLGETKNTQTLSTSQGNTIPDFQNSRQVGEIKDTKRVSNTSQVRAQREAAQGSGREHVIVTGTNTKVSGNASSGSTIKRRDDLGPQGGGGG